MESIEISTTLLNKTTIIYNYKLQKIIKTKRFRAIKYTNSPYQKLRVKNEHRRIQQNS